jgi:TM2 domain-containing membrane protein YozV
MAEEITPPDAAPQTAPPVGNKGFVPAILLCFFLGALGAHRFYVGKIGTGILMLLTLGGFGIWVIIDFVLIVVGSFTDKEGRALAR